MRTTFERVEIGGYKRGPCSVCGQPAERQPVFGQTINPWNRNPDGTVKTRFEIVEELRAERRVWQSEPLKHKRCEATP